MNTLQIDIHSENKELSQQELEKAKEAIILEMKKNNYTYLNTPEVQVNTKTNPIGIGYIHKVGIGYKPKFLKI